VVFVGIDRRVLVVFVGIDRKERECVVYWYSIQEPLHRSGYASRSRVVVCLCLCVSIYSDVLGPLSLRTSGYASSGTSAFSLHLMPSRLAAGAILTHSGSSAAPPPSPTPSHGPISFTYPPHLGFHYEHLL
jgi:hypothetical protein